MCVRVKASKGPTRHERRREDVLQRGEQHGAAARREEHARQDEQEEDGGEDARVDVRRQLGEDGFGEEEEREEHESELLGAEREGFIDTKHLGRDTAGVRGKRYRRGGLHAARNSCEIPQGKLLRAQGERLIDTKHLDRGERDTIYIYMYIHVYTCICIYIYIWQLGEDGFGEEEEREEH